jgi:hypothetical protein
VLDEWPQLDISLKIKHLPISNVRAASMSSEICGHNHLHNITLNAASFQVVLYFCHQLTRYISGEQLAVTPAIFLQVRSDHCQSENAVLVAQSGLDVV